MFHKFLDFLSSVSSTNAWIEETRDNFAVSIDEELLKALASITDMWRALLFQPTESNTSHPVAHGCSLAAKILRAADRYSPT